MAGLGLDGEQLGQHLAQVPPGEMASYIYSRSDSTNRSFLVVVASLFSSMSMNMNMSMNEHGHEHEHEHEQTPAGWR